MTENEANTRFNAAAASPSTADVGCACSNSTRRVSGDSSVGMAPAGASATSAATLRNAWTCDGGYLAFFLLPSSPALAAGASLLCVAGSRGSSSNHTRAASLKSAALRSADACLVHSSHHLLALAVATARIKVV